jgi:predicted nucleic acid-binding protein
MMIVLDTSALSMVFRRRREPEAEHPVVGMFRRLVEDDEDLRVPGVVYQELLSGVRDSTSFTRLEATLEGFPLLLADPPTHRRAAQIRNACRAAGVAAASFDCLIAAHALQHDGALLTLDRDFVHMSPVVGLRLRAVG